MGSVIVGGILTVEGVSFNVEACAKMDKKTFIKTHKEVFFADRSSEDAETILSDTYDLINPPADKAEPETPPKKAKKAD